MDFNKAAILALLFHTPQALAVYQHASCALQSPCRKPIVSQWGIFCPLKIFESIN